MKVMKKQHLNLFLSFSLVITIVDFSGEKGRFEEILGDLRRIWEI
jgi:hypothetical protein